MWPNENEHKAGGKKVKHLAVHNFKVSTLACCMKAIVVLDCLVPTPCTANALAWAAVMMWSVIAEGEAHGVKGASAAVVKAFKAVLLDATSEAAGPTAEYPFRLQEFFNNHGLRTFKSAFRDEIFALKQSKLMKDAADDERPRKAPKIEVRDRAICFDWMKGCCELENGTCPEGKGIHECTFAEFKNTSTGKFKGLFKDVKWEDVNERQYC